ncbi:quinon protein alcohol dehydrogenase-like superfamily [Crucibulum laeve]|uniref:Quinon protein alcohol dehydrogenase-like superfamily n=1 Tax=Crucibulum laeve TaxID=68775 RepID=A0A5C3LW73_9AGAR|nr:quinon protein alcohol dehydrogenase-like superfamily [Crucibulum laeve]
MMSPFDEGFTDGEVFHAAGSQDMEVDETQPGVMSVQDCEELAYRLLTSLPRSRLAAIQRRIAPMLQFDVVGSLPAEVSLQIFWYFPFETLLTCALVSRRWQALANDQALWKNLCNARGWKWRQPTPVRPFDAPGPSHTTWDDSDDEGMGDSDEEEDIEPFLTDVETAKAEITLMHAELDSGFASMSSSSAGGALVFTNSRNSVYPRPRSSRSRAYARHSAPSVLKTLGPSSFLRPDYKLLHQTHIRLRNRFLSPSYRLSALQTRGAPTNSHTNTIYCLQLYTYPDTNRQVLFTGSRDRTVREWNLATGLVERVISDVHTSSVLSICVHNGYIASAGSDRRVAVWNLAENKLVKVICDHEDSVLCVRFDDERLVSCSKDRTVRTYSFPNLTPQFVFGAHRAAVNAVSLSKDLIVSGSGDRSIRLWDARTGKLLRTFDDHHTRGIASIDFSPPFVLSGSSDKHLRLFDMTTLQGWSTSPDYGGPGAESSSVGPLPFPFVAGASSYTTTTVCQSCGAGVQTTRIPDADGRCMHSDLVRSVAFGEDFVLSGSYDLSIKVWDRKTGGLVANLTDGHTGRIFCVGFDYTKIVSCSEDQRICIWDFSHGIDTSFIQLS